MSRLRVFALAALALAAPAAAQVGTCAKGTTRATLETETLAVGLRNTGQLFYGPAEAGQYLVPKSAGTYPVFSADLWISGRVGDSLRTALGYLDPGDFWPGPLPDATAPPADCGAYDRIWSVSRADVERYLRTGEASADLADWPAHLGAPVIDGDGDPSTYDLAAGDQPDLLGDVALWWVTNDAGNAHGGSNWQRTAPLGIEVRTHAFAFEASPYLTVPDGPLQEATFYRYEVANRRAVPIEDMYLSIVAFARTGALGDDYMATDTLRHVVYAYNAHPRSTDAYGDRPVAWGIQVLRGPEAPGNGRDDDYDGTADEPGERLRLSASPPAQFLDGFGFPRSAQGKANVQRGLFPDGEPIYGVGGGARCERECAGVAPTVYAFPADPTTGAFWSEYNTFPNGEPIANGSYYRFLVASVGPFRIEPRATAEVLLAMPFARTEDHLASVTALRTAAHGLLATFGDGVPPRRVDLPAEPPAPPAVRGLARVRPNPGAGGQAAVLALPEPALVRAVVLDALGRVVAVVADGTVGAGETALAVPDALAPGAYLLRVSVDRGAPVAVPFTVLR